MKLLKFLLLVAVPVLPLYAQTAPKKAAVPKAAPVAEPAPKKAEAPKAEAKPAAKAAPKKAEAAKPEAKPAAEPAPKKGEAAKPEAEAPAKPEGAAAPAKAKKVKKPFTNIKLTPGDKERSEVTITPQGKEPLSGVVQAKRGDTFLLDIDGVFTNKGKIAKDKKITLIPEKTKKVEVSVQAAGQSYPGVVFKGKQGLYRLDINNILNARGGYRYRYNAHTFEISQYFGGSAVFSSKYAETKNFAAGMTVLNIYTQNRYKRRNGYSTLVQLRFNYGDAPFHKPASIGLLFGGSQYVFDRRGFESGKGWSMLVNGGMSFDFSSELLNNYFRYPVALGAELEFKAIYNFHKYVGVTFGFLIGYSVTADLTALFGGAPGGSSSNDPDGYPVYTPGAIRTTPGISVDQNFRWGFTAGVIF